MRSIKLRSKGLKPGQLSPDGVIIEVNWDALQVGMSVFIPAINLEELQKQVEEVAHMRQFRLKSAERIENAKLGVRFWRIL